MEIVHELVGLTKLTGFNVAMFFQSWKYKSPDDTSPGGDVLQCGHDFSIMEIISIHGIANIAPMLQCGHDFSIMEIEKLYKEFLKARELQCGHDFSIMEIFNDTYSFYIQSPMLQCGHDFSIMEINFKY